jgi:cytochrome c oxidase accessory protein FixG
MTTRRFDSRRRLAGAAQALLVLGLPFLTIGGESALRLDVPAGRLHALGASFSIDEAFVVLAATLVVTAAFLLVTLLYGRVWCGWSCPQTVLGDLTPRLRGRSAAAPHGVSGRVSPLGAFAVLALVSALFSAALLWYFVSPYEVLRRLAAGTLGPVLGGAWLVLGAILFLDLAFVRQTFCKTVCPYAKLQGVLFDRATLVVAYDGGRAADCVDCGACVRVCPTGIDIREGLQTECIACAACIDACQPIMARLRRRPDLIGYFFGEPGGEARLLRPGALALGAATAAALALLAGAVAGRPVVGLTAMAEPVFRARRTADGRVLNAYSVALENHGRRPVTVRLALRPERERGAVTLRPDVVELAAGERRQVRLLATARALPPGRLDAALEAEVHAGGSVVERREAALSLVVPEAR